MKEEKLKQKGKAKSRQKKNLSETAE